MREGLKELHIFAHLAYVLCNLPLHHLYFRSSVLEKAKQNVEATQEKQKADYDKKHANPSVYAIGSKVLDKDFTLKKRKEGKLDFRWLGPYYIMKNIGKGSYLLQEESTLKEKKSMVLTSNHTLLVVQKKKSQSQLPEKNCRHSIYLLHQFTRLYSGRENSPMSSKPLCNSNDNSSDISSVSPIKPSPVKVASKTTESFQCNTNDDSDVCTLAPVKSSLSKDKCPVISEQTSSTTKSLPSSNPIGSPKSSDFQRKSRHATTIKNKNYVVQRLHQGITSAKQKQNETMNLLKVRLLK